jgi:hypothetical protein
MYAGSNLFVDITIQISHQNEENNKQVVTI